MNDVFKPVFEMTMDDMLNSDYVFQINRPRYSITIYASQFTGVEKDEETDTVFFIMYDLTTHVPVLIYMQSVDEDVSTDCPSDEFIASNVAKDMKSVTFMRKSYYDKMELEEDNG
jgi:hypothetical protein